MSEIMESWTEGLRSPFSLEDIARQPIPRRIFQTWETKNDLHPDMQGAVDEFQSMNPGFEHFLHDDQDRRNFIRENFPPEVLEAYDVLIPGAFRADLWRLCVILKCGGWYADIKYFPRRGFDTLWPDGGRARGLVVCLVTFTGALIHNGFFGAPAGHPWVGRSLDACVRNIRARAYGESSLSVTGPRVVRGVFREIYGQEGLRPGNHPYGKMLFRSGSHVCVINEDGAPERFLSRFPSYYGQRMSQQPGLGYKELWEKRMVYRDDARTIPPPPPPPPPPSVSPVAGPETPLKISLKYIDGCFPSDHVRQVDATYYIDNHPLPEAGRTLEVIDLGAGGGASVDLFRRRFPALRWTGVDIEGSPEVRRRGRTDCEFKSYNGVDLPFADNSVDMVYSRQVFEHVRHPELLLRDIARVLKPNGVFVGSVSQLEPYHSFSLWNFTYYGLAVLAHDAGLTLRELRPGIDGLTLVTRNLVKFHLKWPVDAFKGWFASDSPLNRMIELQFQNQPPAAVNKLKVSLAGHFCFKFEKGAKGNQRGE